MSLGEIFQESMKAQIKGDTQRLEELNRMQKELIEKLRKERDKGGI